MIALGLGLFFIIRNFFLDAAMVNLSSMYRGSNKRQLVFFQPLVNPTRGDIVILRRKMLGPDSSLLTETYVKRVIALPGDTILVDHGQVFVNQVSIPENAYYLHNYILQLRSMHDTSELLAAGINIGALIDDSNAYMTQLTESELSELQTRCPQVKVQHHSEDSELFDEEVFPHHPSLKWNSDNFGPLYIPKMGIKIPAAFFPAVCYYAIPEYQKIFRLDSGHFDKGSLQKVKPWLVSTCDMYFAVGDNFDNSIDSRHWGFILRNEILGKVVFRKDTVRK